MIRRGAGGVGGGIRPRNALRDGNGPKMDPQTMAPGESTNAIDAAEAPRECCCRPENTPGNDVVSFRTGGNDAVSFRTARKGCRLPHNGSEIMLSPSERLGNHAVSLRTARKSCRLPQVGSEAMPSPSERLGNHAVSLRTARKRCRLRPKGWEMMRSPSERLGNDDVSLRTVRE
jgi:hypothetical protein